MEVYTKRQLCPNLWQITEQHSADKPGVQMYLVTGKEKSALVDCGFGVCDTLRTFAEEAAGTSVICIVAHGHPDHAGAAALFDEIYMNERDEKLLPVSLSYERRMDDVFGRGVSDPEHFEYCKNHIVMTEQLNYKNMDDGDTFDLGGETLQVIAIPGHTQGSVVLVNRARNYALVSDAFSYRTALVRMPTEKRVGITNYRDGLARFLSAINDDTAIYWGHGAEQVDHCIPRDMLQACNEVLDGKIENDRESQSHFSKRKNAGGSQMREHVCGSVMLVYNANTL